MDQEKRLLKTLMCAQGSPDNFAVRRLTSASLRDRDRWGSVCCVSHHRNSENTWFSAEETFTGLGYNLVLELSAYPLQLIILKQMEPSGPACVWREIQINKQPSPDTTSGERGQLNTTSRDAAQGVTW